MKIGLDLIRPSPRPVRSSWDEEKMEGLAQSIKEQGLIVPVKVRPVGNEYELVYGHRRVEAARRMGLEEIEAIVEGVDDTNALIQALIENVQREDLSALDKARALRALKQETGWSNREVHRRGIMEQGRLHELLVFLEEYEAGVVPEMMGMPIGHDEGVRKTREVHRALGDDIDAKRAVLQKAADEELTYQQTRRVADTIAKTKDPKRREFLLQTPYASYSFDPDYAEEAERQWHQGKPATDKVWQEAPEAKMVLLMVSKWREALKASKEAVALGKLAPEGKPFLVKKLQVFVAELQAWINELEA